MAEMIISPSQRGEHLYERKLLLKHINVELLFAVNKRLA
jgi:hypothetical protein